MSRKEDKKAQRVSYQREFAEAKHNRGTRLRWKGKGMKPKIEETK